MDILRVNNLTKQFGEYTAVSDISFTIGKGEILGLLGPNGAGKTTTIQMLLGVLTPTNGAISYFDKPLSKNREEILERLNFSSTYTNLPWQFTVKECLKTFSYFYNIKDRKQRIAEVVEDFKLQDIYSKVIGDLSAGQITRVNLAKSFINHPEVLLLDEPTASLDPDIALYIRNFLLQKRTAHTISIIITSHNMAEVEQLCDRVIFIHQGKILANDTPQNLAKTIKNSHIELLVANIQKMKQYCDQRKCTYMQTENRFIVDVPETEIAAFLRALTENQIHYDEISIEKPSLEDFFLAMAKKRRFDEAL